MERKCRECGARVELEKHPMKTRLAMMGARMCQECLRWHDVLERILDPASLRIEGVQYFIRDDIPDTPGTAEETILRDDGELTTTRSLVRMGRVPAHFANRLQDNAVFVQTLKGVS